MFSSRSSWCPVADAGRIAIAGEPTLPYLPIFDTGEFEAQPDLAEPPAAKRDPGLATSPAARSARPEPSVVAPLSTVASGEDRVKRWKFAMVVAAVWAVAAGVGLGLYYWWIEDMTPHKVWPVFVVLVYLVVCVVGSLLLAMVQGKPLISALAVAVMSAPLASTAAAAALYGAYVFHWIER